VVCTEVSDGPAVLAELNTEPPRRRFRPFVIAGRVAHGVASAAEWLFGLVCLVVGLSTLAALSAAPTGESETSDRRHGQARTGT
jgi:hypothetical protein